MGQKRHKNQPEQKATRPGRLELFADPRVEMAWAAIQTLPEGLLQEFEQLLHEYVTAPEKRKGVLGDRLARATSAVRDVATILEDETGDATVSVDAYERVRKQNRELGLPTAGSVRRWSGGSWNDVLRRARLKAVPDGDVLALSYGDKFAWEEVRDGVRACAEELRRHGLDPERHLGYQTFLGWGKRDDVLAMPGRRPRSRPPFNRFGGWLAVKDAALNGDGSPPTAGRGSERIGPARGYRYSDEELREAIREVAAHMGRTPRASEYGVERERILAAEEARGDPPRALPSYGKLLAHYGCWDTALADAGFVPHFSAGVNPATGRGYRLRDNKSFPDEQLIAGIQEAYAAKGEPFTMVAYAEYRAERNNISLSGQRLAAYATLWGRYKGWEAACKAAGIER